MEIFNTNILKEALIHFCKKMDIISDPFISYAFRYFTYSNVYKFELEISGNSKICYISYSPNPKKIILFKSESGHFEYGEIMFDIIKNIFKDYVDYKLSH